MKSAPVIQATAVGRATLALLFVLAASPLHGAMTDFEHWCPVSPKSVDTIADVNKLTQVDICVRLGTASADVARALAGRAFVTHLDVSSVDIVDEVLSVLVVNLSLTAINISYCERLTDSGLRCLAGETNLEVLFARGNLHFKPGVLGAIATKTQLTILDIGFEEHQEADDRRITSLSADFVPLVDKGALVRFAIRNSLKCDDALVELIAQLDSLKSVDIGYCPLVSGKGVAALMSLPVIESIEAPLGAPQMAGHALRDASGSDKQVWQALSTSAVEYLDVSYRSGFDDDHAYVVMKRATIKGIRLRGMFELGPAGLSFLSKTPTLKTLDIGDCDKLLEDTIAYISTDSAIEDISYGAFAVTTKTRVNRSLSKLSKRRTIRRVLIGLNTTRLSEWSLEDVELDSLTLQLFSTVPDPDFSTFATTVVELNTGIGTLEIRGASASQVQTFLPLVDSGPHRTLRFVHCEIDEEMLQKLNAIKTNKHVGIE